MEINSAQTSHKHHGFKVFLSHLKNVEGLETILREPERKAVILYRDFPATYASTMRAQATGVWVRKVGWERNEDVLQAPVRYTEESFTAQLADYVEMMRRFKALALEKGAFVITYEQVGRPDVMAELLKFIGSKASPETLSTKYQKQFKGDLRDGIENWSEFEAALAKLDGLPILDPTVA